MCCVSPMSNKIRAGGEVLFFEYHKFVGPTLLAQDGWTPVHLPEDEDHPFWNALTAWIHHGMKVDTEGFAIMEAQP